MVFRFSEPERQHFVQYAYHVVDLDDAIERWSATTGIGPFFVRRHIMLCDVHYRGVGTSLDISAAMVQSGNVQVELVQQHCDSPSAFRDMFAADEAGIHHVAVAPTDGARMLDHYRSLGFPVATGFMTRAGGGADYVDARPAFGHMIEVYRVSDRIIDLYAQVAEAAEGWDGKQVVIEITP